ncbi:CopG domain protein DNA-binding domain protein (modular protein) [Candidatus Sulfopaludibacter sp. SbA4]|nr:CopG domain protein DNA-binding domain protein (modular protein) [Candidatus Sulfopaludibacter sp. SbA4]
MSIRWNPCHIVDSAVFQRRVCGTLEHRESWQTQNNLHIPDDLLNAVSEAASADGKTTDEIAADALRRYLEHRKLQELGNYGREQSRRLGYTEADVSRLIAESRRENRATEYSRTASLTCEPEVPAWLTPTVQSLVDLLRLPQNWDGYGAAQIQEQIAQKVLMVLVEVMENDAPAPSVVPLSDGGIQVEWHRRARNLEIEFPAGQAPSFCYYQDGCELESEGQVSGNYDRIQAYIANLK